MEKSRVYFLSAVIGLGLYAIPLTALYANIDMIIEEGPIVAITPPLSAQPVIVKYYRGIRYETYATSHVIVSTAYDRPVVQNIVTLSDELGWDTFYIQTSGQLKEYSTQYNIEDDTTCGRKDCSAQCGRKGCSPCAQKIYSPNCESVDCSIPCDTGCSSCCF